MRNMSSGSVAARFWVRALVLLLSMGSLLGRGSEMSSSVKPATTFMAASFLSSPAKKPAMCVPPRCRPAQKWEQPLDSVLPRCQGGQQ